MSGCEEAKELSVQVTETCKTNIQLTYRSRDPCEEAKEPELHIIQRRETEFASVETLGGLVL